MLTGIAIVPSAPVVVPELAGAAAAETADLRRAIATAVATLPGRWVALGVGDHDETVTPDRAGTFAGYGVDVRVLLSPTADSVGELPLCALIAGWVRGDTRPDARVDVRVYRHGEPAAVARGRALRAEIDATPEPVGVLIVADGANTLTTRAPGGHVPESVAVQAALDDALAAGDHDALTRVPGSVVGQVAWQVLAGLAGTGSVVAREIYRGAPYGVGYFVGVWEPAS